MTRRTSDRLDGQLFDDLGDPRHTRGHLLRIFGVHDARTGEIASLGRNQRFVTMPNGFARYAEPDGIELSADGIV